MDGPWGIVQVDVGGGDQLEVGLLLDGGDDHGAVVDGDVGRGVHGQQLLLVAANVSAVDVLHRALLPQRHGAALDLKPFCAIQVLQNFRVSRGIGNL